MDNNILNNPTLEINLNEEYRIKVENGGEFKTSIFKDVYEAALKNVKDIVEQAPKAIKNYDDFNNIIAFTGERGKGKSSSMISFRNALVDSSNRENISFFKKSSNVYNNKFATIDIIDPSLFRGDESLFEIILAQMFEKFQKEISRKNSRLNDDSRRKIIKQFQIVFENLQIINSDRKELYKKESIEALSRLATSSNLRECFRALVEIYLKEFEQGKDFLVIAIDDFDLNISGVYEMLEDIRQFLIQSKIILFIACKIEQLKETITIHFKNQNIAHDLENKSKRYIDKIFPFERRLILPDLSKQVQENFEIVKENNLIYKTENNSFKVNILKLLYDKVALFQPLNLLKQNPIVPDTIRQTQNFISVVFSKNNDENLKNYLLDEIENNKDLYEDISELEDLSDDTFLLLLNKKLINLYKKKNLRTDSERFSRPELPKSIKALDNATIPGRIGIGDIVCLLRELENSVAIDDYFYLKLLGYLKLYISLKIKILMKYKDKSFLKYGFTNIFTEFLSKDKGLSRDHIEFNKNSISTQLQSLNKNETLIFVMWSQHLGIGYQEYRHTERKDIFVEFYDKGHISPLALLHNIYNLQELSQHYDIDTHTDLYKELMIWKESSTFLAQLCNPSFVLIIMEYVKEFRNREVKETLPNNYYDTVCLLFNYGILYALDKIQIEYKIEGLASDYLKNPIFFEMLQGITSKNISFSAVNVLNKKYSISSQDKTNIKNDSKSIVDLINKIYESYKIENSTQRDHEKTNLPFQAIEILNNLKWNLENAKITSRLVGNRVNELLKINNLDKLIIGQIDSLKYGLNQEETYEVTKENLLSLINTILTNG